jgi:hypothetical protein
MDCQIIWLVCRQMKYFCGASSENSAGKSHVLKLRIKIKGARHSHFHSKDDLLSILKVHSSLINFAITFAKFFLI